MNVSATRERIGHKVGDKNVQRKALAPRFRATSVFKRELYKLACDIHDRGGFRILEFHVRQRDGQWGVFHRLTKPTPIDWTLWLVRGRLLGPAPASGVKKPTWLFGGTLLTRLSVELNFAFRNWIEPSLITMFIDEFGGHEIISARRAIGDYDLREEAWVMSLQRRKKPNIGIIAGRFIYTDEPGNPDEKYEELVDPSLPRPTSISKHDREDWADDDDEEDWGDDMEEEDCSDPVYIDTAVPFDATSSPDIKMKMRGRRSPD
ncbi:hypothetical protein ASE00_16270 [Sphingomonas sp. Root710]|nr:hypothetical protein ASE00_16270 [Sphingomonas sp. Root710]